MFTRHLFAVLIPAAAIVSVSSFGCGVTSSIDDHTDCHGICNRYADCFDAEYDVSGCETRCEDKAERTQALQDDVDSCATCISDEACTAQSATCKSVCAPIVP